MTSQADPSIQVSDSVFARMREIQAVEGPDKMLRVSVLGGGCSGFQYKFDLDDRVQAGDAVIERQGIRVLVDPESQPFLAGARIEWKDELIGAHFAIDNPNASSACGCGVSFSL